MLSKRIARGAANRLIMGGTSFSFPTAPATQGDVLAYHAASAALLPTSRAWAIATTSTAGITLANTTAAAAGAQQYSPALQLEGRGWKTDATAGSQAAAWRLEVQPVQAAAAPTSAIHFLSSIAGAAYTSRANLSTIGLLSTVGVTTSSVITAIYARIGTQDLASGLGLGSYLYQTTGDYPMFLFNPTRGDAASNIVHASVYDRNAASITNAATMRLWSGGWTNNADAYTELGALYCDGSLWSSTGVRFPAYAVASLPTAGAVGQVIYCSNGNTGAKCLAMWDGSNWLRIVLGAAVSAS